MLARVVAHCLLCRGAWRGSRVHGMYSGSGFIRTRQYGHVMGSHHRSSHHSYGMFLVQQYRRDMQRQRRTTFQAPVAWSTRQVYDSSRFQKHTGWSRQHSQLLQHLRVHQALEAKSAGQMVYSSRHSVEAWQGYHHHLRRSVVWQQRMGSSRQQR